MLVRTLYQKLYNWLASRILQFSVLLMAILTLSAVIHICGIVIIFDAFSSSSIKSASLLWYFVVVVLLLCYVGVCASNCIFCATKSSIWNVGILIFLLLLLLFLILFLFYCYNNDKNWNKSNNVNNSNNSNKDVNTYKNKNRKKNNNRYKNGNRNNKKNKNNSRNGNNTRISNKNKTRMGLTVLKSNSDLWVQCCWWMWQTDRRWWVHEVFFPHATVWRTPKKESMESL